MQHVIGEDPHGLFGIARHATNRYLAKRKQQMYWYDEIFSAACEGVIKAQQSFDESLGVDFEWWALRKARSAIVDEVRRRAPLSRGDYKRGLRVDDVPAAQIPHSVDALNDQLETSGWEWLQPSAATTDEIKRADDRDVLRRLIRHLTPRQQYVLYKTDVEDVTYLEIADELGVSESRICQIRREALTKLRRRAA